MKICDFPYDLIAQVSLPYSSTILKHQNINVDFIIILVLNYLEIEHKYEVTIAHNLITDGDY